MLIPCTARTRRHPSHGATVTLLCSDKPEVKYVALRNVLLLIQKRPDILQDEMKVFFCEYNDPIYVKLAKLEVMVRKANAANVELVLSELKEYVGGRHTEVPRNWPQD